MRFLATDTNFTNHVCSLGLQRVGSEPFGRAYRSIITLKGNSKRDSKRYPREESRDSGLVYASVSPLSSCSRLGTIKEECSKQRPQQRSRHARREGRGERKSEGTLSTSSELQVRGKQSWLLFFDQMSACMANSVRNFSKDKHS